jgi:hypothetical protein
LLLLLTLTTAAPAPEPLSPVVRLLPCSKKKTLARKVASHAVKIVVVALMLIACGGWMWAHKHKKALHAHLDTTLSTLNVAESDKSELR